MKVRFYCDIPAHGVRVTGPNDWTLFASTKTTSSTLDGYTRVAFDVDMPPGLVLPQHDVMAPGTDAKVIE